MYTYCMYKEKPWSCISILKCKSKLYNYLNYTTSTKYQCNAFILKNSRIVKKLLSLKNVTIYVIKKDHHSYCAHTNNRYILATVTFLPDALT